MIINPYRFASGSGDPYWSSVVLLAHLNGTNGGTTFTDSSSSAKTLTARGNAQTSTAQSKFNGSSALSDGSGDYVTTPDHADFTFDGDFTIECFFRITATGAGDLISKRTGAAWIILYQASGTVYIYMSSNNSSWNVASGVSVGAVSTNTWYYLALKRSGSTITAHLGTSGSTSSVSIATSSATFDSTNSFSILGNYGNTPNECMTGNMAEVRVTKGVARDVSSVPTAAFPDS